MIRSLALAITLVLGLALAWVDIRVPDPVGPDAPATAFSSARAFAAIDEMGKSPHPIDSVRHDQVRDYLIGRLKDLGLEVRVQNARAFHEWDIGGRQIVSGADVQNLIGVMPGKDRSAKPLAIMAHYDSVPGSPGASDDASGVAVALEVARALKAQGQPARDVDLIITDGEENGLVGAHAFFGQDPLAKQVGFVINMDTRGSGGRTFMFQTASGNGQAVDLFQKTAVDPRANSLAVFIYEHMPNDTDYTVAKAAGVQGLNYAFMGREFDYHSPSATPERTQPGSIQDLGRQVLSAAHALAFDKTLPVKAPDKVFGDLYGKIVIAYPPLIGWLVLLVGIVFYTVAALRARRQGELGWIETVRSLSAAIALLFFAAALTSFVRDATFVPRGFVDQLPLLARFGWFEAAIGLAVLGGVLVSVGAFVQGRRRLWAIAIPLVLGIACYGIGRDVIGAGAAVGAALFATPVFGRPVRPWSVVAGFLKLGFVLAILAQLFAPAAAFIVEWPLLVISLGVLIASFTGGLDRPAAQIACGIAAVLFLGWGLGQIHMLALGVGADLPAALGPFFWIAALALIPLIVVLPRPITAGGIALAAALVTLGVIVFDNPATPRYPRATEVMYVRDADTGRYFRASLLDKLDPWTEQTLKVDGGRIHKQNLFPLGQDPVFVSDAPAAGFQNHRNYGGFCDAHGCAFALPGGPVDFYQPNTGESGDVTISLAPHSGPGRVILAVRSNVALNAEMNEQPLAKPTKPGTWLLVVWARPDCTSNICITTDNLHFKAPPNAKIEVRYAMVSPGWPPEAKPLPSRPGNVMAYSSSDSAAEIGSIKIDR